MNTPSRAAIKEHMRQYDEMMKSKLEEHNNNNKQTSPSKSPIRSRKHAELLRQIEYDRQLFEHDPELQRISEEMPPATHKQRKARVGKENTSHNPIHEPLLLTPDKVTSH